MPFRLTVLTATVLGVVTNAQPEDVPDGALGRRRPRRPAAHDRRGRVAAGDGADLRRGPGAEPLRHRRGRQPPGPSGEDPGPDHQEVDRRDRGGGRARGGALQLRDGAGGRDQPARLRRDHRHRRGGRRAVDAGEPDRRPAGRVQRRDPARRRGHRRGGVGLGRGDHPVLRRGPALGRPPDGAAVDVLHQDPLPELDAAQLRAPRRGRAGRRLARGRRGHARRARPDPRRHRPVGRADQGPPGDRGRRPGWSASGPWSPRPTRPGCGTCAATCARSW